MMIHALASLGLLAGAAPRRSHADAEAEGGCEFEIHIFPDREHATGADNLYRGSLGFLKRTLASRTRSR